MKKELKAFFNRNQGRGYKSKDISKKLGFITEYEYASLKAALHKLEEEGFLIKTGKRYQLNKIPSTNKLTGKLEINKNGYGFVIINNGNINDIFISSGNMGAALDGDLVEV
ncbi:MAG: ribonuclease R, partial [Ignavibacterium sp.]